VQLYNKKSFLDKFLSHYGNGNYCLWQTSMNLFVLSGRQNDVLYVDGLKIGTTTKLSSASGNIASSVYYEYLNREN